MKKWLAIHSKPRQENTAEENLIRQGFEVYCPKIRMERKTRGKRIKVIEALFPRYLFVRFEPGHDCTASISYTRGVRQIIRFGSELAIVSDDIVRLLKSSASHSSGLHVELVPEFKKGDQISIIDGPFMGLSGVFHKSNAEERVIILLNVLGEQNRVALQREQVALAAV